MDTRIRSRLFAAVMCAVLMACLAGCGARVEKDNKAEQVREDSGRTREEQKEDFFKRLASQEGGIITSHCIYEIDDESSKVRDSYNYDIVQRNRQGKELDRHEIKFIGNYGDDLVEGSDQRLILSGTTLRKGYTDVADKEILYQIPIKQTEAGEKVMWEQQEKMASVRVSGESEQYLVEPYLIYCNEKTVVRMNLETREKKYLSLKEELSDTDDLHYFGLKDEGSLYLSHINWAGGDLESRGDAHYYRIDIENWEAEEIFSDSFVDQSIALQEVSGSDLYLEYSELLEDEPGVESLESPFFHHMVCYDREKKKSVGRLERKDLEQLFEQEKLYGSPKNRRYFDLDALFPHGDRMYMVCELYTNIEGEKDEEIYDQRQILISCSRKGMADLSYEGEISEWWYHNTGVRSDKDSEVSDSGPREIRYGNLIDGFENEFYFTYRDRRGEMHLMCYDLERKKKVEIGKGELAYQIFDFLGYLQED